MTEWKDLRMRLNGEGLKAIEILPQTDCEKTAHVKTLLEEQMLIAIVEPPSNELSVFDVPKLITTSDSDKRNLLNSPNVRAIAGPMSPKMALEVKNRVTPVRSRGMRFTQSEKIRRIRLTDPEKGLETICRPICAKNGIKLQEKWAFLNDAGFLDMKEENSLRKRIKFE